MTYTPDDVWRLLGELIAAQKETERRFQETDRILKEQSQETDRILKEQSQETDRRFQETDRILKEQSQKTDRQIQRVSQDIGKLGNRLGEFVEWQVRPAAVQLFQQRGIDVHELQAGVSVKRNGEGLEIDLLVINDTEAVLIEVIVV